ncbi:unnamed protein product [Kuraishia capsulata CBS 1993]|uniref:Maintenance of telomere capping protein 5 n=1 Tax=Kuraishia capsulata CBS 1993 TaxID=1382522 RepID=W6MX38_9ASCO|nr:uncharacterized protein KUCA_T00004197001 [Kuraishia capsulata CBS 1993]CDK28215.1 unnamed protein product [Kuraishia capsulata CBS 1993]
METQKGSPYDSATFGNSLSLRVDGAIGAMSLSPCGRDAVLAGRRGLFVIDLDDPFAQPRWLHHVTSWEVADVQWSPHKSKPSWVVSTSNQKALVWNLARSSTDAIEHVLHAHDRAITDINFHPDNPEVLATCSVDTFSFAWDLRTPRRPVARWADWRSATSQVKWNYKNPNIIASAHDNYFYIWDMRKGAMPLEKIMAHNGRVNGLDFSRDHETEIISCSNDMTVKFWDYGESVTEPKFTINTDFPVSRARHVPFGDKGCGIMPAHGGNNSVYIVNYKDQTGESKLRPGYIFKGHTEPVKDFLWRSRHSDNTSVDDRDVQLVTWSKDNDLRLWPVSEDIYDRFNYEKNKELPEGTKLIDFDYRTYRSEPVTSSDDRLKRFKKDAFVSSRGSSSRDNQFNHLDWISGVRIGQSAQAPSDSPNAFSFGGDSLQPANLGEEVSSVGHKFPKLRFEKISVSTGQLILSLNGPWSATNKEDLVFLRMEINFPKDYPSKTGKPTFNIEENQDLDSEKEKEILQNLNEISERFCGAGRHCLEQCLRSLLGEKVSLEFDAFDENDLPLDPFDIPQAGDFNDVESMPTSLSDDSDDELVPITSTSVQTETDGMPFTKPAFDSTPIPKGCGAVWTASGHLVCFFIPKHEENKPTQLKFDQQGFTLAGTLKKKKAGSSVGDASSKGGRVASSKLEDSSGESSDSDSYSSDDSFSNDLDILQNDRPYRSAVTGLMRKNVGLRHYTLGEAKSATLGNASVPTERSLGTQTSRGHNSNIVTIHDFSDLIPSKMELAYEYRMLGDTPEKLSVHNAAVAEKYGYKDIADCWKILEVILVKDVHLPDILNNSDLSVVLQHELHQKFVTDLSKVDVETNYRFYWGAHPFGSRWLARAIMEYYEKLGNIQMLAMLACIMHEHKLHKTDPTIPIHTPYMRPPTLVNKQSVIGRFASAKGSNVGDNELEAVGNSACSSVSSYDASGSVSFHSGSPERFGSYFKRGIGNVPPLPGVSPTNSGSRKSVVTMTSRTSSFLIPQKSHILQGAPKVKIQMFNEVALDLSDDVYSVPLLDPAFEEKYQMYRSQYASLLFYWGLPVNRIKVLKFNYEDSIFKNSAAVDEYRGQVGLNGYSDTHIKDLSKAKVLKEQKLCNYCSMTIKKRLIVCTTCNHIMHADCAMQWWEGEQQTECPGGCGCICLSKKFYEH